MKSFFVVALAAYANAVCEEFDAVDGSTCTDFPEIDEAVMTYAGNYTFQLVDVPNDDSTTLRMIQFTGNTSSSDPVAGQGEKGVVLMLASYTQDCLDLLT